MQNQRIKIAQVKKGIYNPNLPSWRTMSMDDTLGKLSDEHVRTSIPVGVDLPKELFYQYNSSSHYIPNYEVLPLYFMKWEEDKMAETLSFLNNPQLEERWKEFKKYLPMGMHRVEHIPQVKDFHYMNYQVRYQRPEARNCFKQYPIKDRGVRAMPQPIKSKESPKKEEETDETEDCVKSVCVMK
ncbi:sperm microtubule inner protein 8 isoform X2 [Halyomorpha halys]|uniref:sperm microtubule inner protein 8 isoform X2 n=1 Tax=Halyomorpha halys TaxID=286706 RepID=UPI000D0C8466|nr:testis, prostate and placenta-expressed protein-like isoform X2 [Halyomorpha halys]